MASSAAFRDAAILKRLVAAVGPMSSGRVLDLACGPGIVSEAIAPHVAELVGVDVTPEMLRLARARFQKAKLEHGAFHEALVERLPYRNGSFDQVITRLSFHHFEDLHAVLSEIRRVLKPGGKLVLADVVSSEDEDESSLQNALEKLRDPTHVRMLPYSELRALLLHNRFEVLKDEAWFQERTFDEWAAIIAARARTEPLARVMRGLARAGEHAGIALHEEAGDLKFTHTWVLLVAEAGSNWRNRG